MIKKEKSTTTLGTTLIIRFRYPSKNSSTLHTTDGHSLLAWTYTFRGNSVLMPATLVSSMSLGCSSKQAALQRRAESPRRSSGKRSRRKWRRFASLESSSSSSSRRGSLAIIYWTWNRIIGQNTCGLALAKILTVIGWLNLIDQS